MNSTKIFNYLNEVLRLRSNSFNLSNKYLSNINGFNQFQQSFIGDITLEEWKFVNFFKLDQIILFITMNLNLILGNIKYKSTFNNFIITINYYSNEEANSNETHLKVFHYLASIIASAIGKSVTIKLVKLITPLGDSTMFSKVINIFSNKKRMNILTQVLNKNLIQLSNYYYYGKASNNFIKGNLSGITIDFNGRSEFRNLSNRKLKSTYLIGRMNRNKTLFTKSNKYTLLNTKGLYTVKVTYSYNK